MSRYYQGSKFFKWLRKKVFKIEKPVALGWGEWDTWEEELKSKRPVAFFFTETLPEWIQWIPNHSIEYLSDLRIWISNYLDNTHGLSSTLKKGQYHEFNTRLLHSAFDSFADFVECEEAHSHVAWANKEEAAKYNIPWHQNHWVTRLGRAWRCPQAGIDHLKWEMTLTEDNKPTYQAIAAIEKMTLYTWWKDIRPNRGDEWDTSGLGAFWEYMDKKYGKDSDWLGLGTNTKMSASEQQNYDRLYEEKYQLERNNKNEDTEMLIRLIKIRDSLWT